MAQQPPPSPSASSVLLPFLNGRSRRGSLASLTSTKGAIDKDALAQKLDTIHTSASKSETLTSFHDFDGGASRSASKEATTSGAGGLYDKFLRGFGGGTPLKEVRDRPKSSASRESVVTDQIQSKGSPKTNGFGVKNPTADSASLLSNKSATVSPRAPTFTNTGASLELAAGERKSDTRQKTADESGDKPSLTIDTKSKSRDESTEPRKVKSGQATPSLELSAHVDDDQIQPAVQALSKVLSQHEASQGVRRPRSLSTQDQAEQAVDDSDSDLKSRKSRSPRVVSVRKESIQDLEQSLISKDGIDLQNDLQRPAMPIGVSHLPGYAASRASSTDGGDLTSRANSRKPTRPRLEPPIRLDGSLQHRDSTHIKPSMPSQPLDHIPSHLKRRVISKAFWMKDENAKDCFYCGQSFSTFRRKHHCRTCGQIFDAKCTSLVSGRPFGQPGTIRLCKPCEAMIYGSDDDSTVVSDDASEYPRSPLARRRWTNDDDNELPGRMDSLRDDDGDVAEVATPSIGIPTSRRNREAKRRSAIIEFDAAPALTRPTSSHSLISLAGRRPRSGSHRRHNSRHQTFRHSRLAVDERGPFQPGISEDPTKNSTLPAFHNDNIIDPDLAIFASDEGSDGDDQPNIFAAMNGDVSTASPNDRERTGFGGMFTSAMKKGRSRLGTVSSVKGGIKEDEALAQATKHLPKLSRNRNPSMGSITVGRPSPRRSRSNMLLKPCVDSTSFERRPDSPRVSAKPTQGAKLVRSSAMRGKDAPPIELNRASLEHVRKLLAQLLKDNNVESASSWEKALLPILLQSTDDVEPNVQLGDDMDVRHYIKLKKIPGGRPGDTSYVSGVVFSKNIALKSMARCIAEPRIATVTFAIEYARHQTHFMSLEPVIAQEQEYLRNLVGRIAALRPHVLLVQRNVSGSALHLLEKAGITVVYNIKESVLAAVARVTQTSLIKSVDKLAMHPSHLGQCDSFEVKTYVHEGLRKSYVYLSGCQPDLGCTIVLRGARTKDLKKIKRITEFMCYVAYNLKLETNLLRDEFVSIPTSSGASIETSGAADYTETSAGGADHLSEYEQLEHRSRSRILSASPFVVFMQPYLLTQLRDSEMRLATHKRLRDMYAAADDEGDENEKDIDGEGISSRFEIVKPDMVHETPSKVQSKAVRDYLHAVHDAQLEKTTHTYETQKRLMESFISGDSDPFDPASHQTIVVLHSTVSKINSAPCVGPELVGIGFYAGFNHVEPNFEEDCTVGQYIEDLCISANSTCKDCGKRMHDHHRQYVHGYGQVSVSVQRQPAKMRGYQKTILMWATCRVCKQETTVTPMSDNTWKYSFAKYLELTFWSSSLHPRAGVCQHDIHKDFMRCFGFEDLVVCFHYDPVDIYNVVVPRPTITWKVEADLNVKNGQYSRFVNRLNAFTASIRKRLDSINVDTLEEKKAIEAHELLSELRTRVEDDHTELLQKLQQKYADSRYYELIPLNRALRFMDEKALAWDDVFNNFERDYFPSETDIRKLATLQLRNMFLESQPPPSTIASDMSDNEDVTEVMPKKPKMLPRGLTDIEIYREKAHDVLSSTLEEHRGSVADISNLSTTNGNQPDDDDAATGLMRTVSPREEQEVAVEREDVKHLDLALPAKSPENSSPEERSESSETSTQASRPGTGDSQSHSEPFATQIKTMGPGLLERIEQIRSIRPAGMAEQEGSESKIPRLVDLKKREASPRPSKPPPLNRAMSSPSSSPTHEPKRSVDMGSEHSIDSIANAQLDHENPPPEKRLSERFGVSRLASKVSRVAPSLIPRSIPLKSDDAHSTKVSALAKHFEQMSREFERERLKERRQRALRNRQARANPLASSRPVVEVYRNATEAVGERIGELPRADHAKPHPSTAEEVEDIASSDHQPIADSASHIQLPSSDEIQPDEGYASPLKPRKPRRDHLRIDSDTETDEGSSDLERPHVSIRDVSDPTPGTTSGLISPISISETELHPELTIPEHKKNVWFKYLAEFWSKRSASGWANLEYPLRAMEHVFEDSDIIVREDEPSSVIALALACADYQVKVQDFRGHPKRHTKQRKTTKSQTIDSFVEGDGQQKAIEASLLSDTGTHMKYSFAHGPVKASCKIFYAESFDALRRKCGVADRFMESLTRCLKFDSKGGKTKSLFLKTLDNRFYLKSLQEVELKAFTKFAPDYFAFMSHTLFHGVPSVIAKMFGLFQVMIKNPTTGTDFSYYFLVMENLFYERTPTRRFDLKGSMRNRKIESTGQPDEVLLDENLVETIFESPLFVREHARRLLQASVWNDTMWLCKQNVMDYSLMAGFDDTHKELVVGIIDCIRTYTWDKKLESWIKDRGKNKPTITSPKDYRNRFRVSMMQYCLTSPSPWHQFQAQIPLPKPLKEKDPEADERDERVAKDRRPEVKTSPAG